MVALTFEELELMHDDSFAMPPDAARRIALAQARAAGFRRSVRRAIQARRMVLDPSWRALRPPEDLAAWDCRTLLNLRESWTHYRISLIHLRQISGRMEIPETVG